MTTQTTPTTNTVTLTINGISVTVPKGTTVYQAATQLGICVPIFCYQDRMPPFGACRMCLVEVEKMPKLQTSCTLEATEGMVVNTESEKAVQGRQGIIEFLLINHPLDCPICDRGGECPLQENALSHGSGISDFYEAKRHFKKALPLGPVLMLDRERCIVCARCTRFGEIIAGDNALEFIDRGYKTEVGTPNGGPAESKFIGNTIMICPVGALTSQVYRFRARPWDNTPTNSTCTLCPVGCSMILDSRDGDIMRTRSLENKDVNDIWLCDKGWFGYEYTYNANRLVEPLVRKNGKLEVATWEEAIELIASKLKAANKEKTAAWGGTPLTNEENYLYQKLFREMDCRNLDYRIGMPIQSAQDEGMEPGMHISIGDTEKLKYAILFGLDITEEFPVIWLRLKQALNHGAKVLYFGNYTPEIARHLSEVIIHPPGKEIESIQKYANQIGELAKAGQGALFVGKQYLDGKNRKAILAELLKLTQSNPNLSLNILEGRGNSMGARFAGMLPDKGPLRQPISQPGLNAIQVLDAGSKNGWDYLHIAGADPISKYPQKIWDAFRSQLGFLVVQDFFLTETAKQADVVLPILSYVEKGGTFLNIEGRVQRLLPGKVIPDKIYSDSQIFTMLGVKLGLKLSLDGSYLEQIKQDKVNLPKIEKIDAAAMNGYATDGLYATFVHSLFDNGIRMKHNPHVIQLAKDPGIRINPAEGAKRNIKDGDLVQIAANGNMIIAKIKLDAGVAQNTIVLPLGFDKTPVRELGTNLLNGMPIEIKV